MRFFSVVLRWSFAWPQTVCTCAPSADRLRITVSRVFIPLAVIYCVLVFSSLTAPGGLDIFTSGSAVTLAALSKAFADPGTMAAGWAHYVCFDLFVGRWVWADGLRNRVVTIHSLVLGALPLLPLPVLP